MFQKIKENKTVHYVLFGIILYLNLLALCHVDSAKGLGDNAGETVTPVFYAIGTGIMLVRFRKVQDVKSFTLCICCGSGHTDFGL